MDKFELSDEQKRDLTLIADLGFQYAMALDSIPDEIKNLYVPFYKKVRLRSKIRKNVIRFSSITRAIVKGYTVEECVAYRNLIDNKNKEHENI